MKNIYRHFIKFSFLFFTGIVFSIYLSSIFVEKIYISSSLKNLKDFTEKTIENIKIFKDEQLYNFLNTLSEINNTRITLIKENGEVIYDTHSDAKKMENHLNREEVSKSLKYGEANSIRFSNTLNAKMIYFAKKITLNDKTYIIRTAKIISDLTHFIKPYKSKFTFFMGILFLTIFSFIFIYFRNFVKKIDTLQSVINRISKGDFDSLITIDKNDIFYPLTKNINALAESLKNLTEDIKNQKELLYNILEDLPFPVVIADESKQILIRNKFFREYFPNINSLEELINLIRNENLYNALRALGNETGSFNIEISLKDKYFSLFGNKIFYQNNELILFTFIDITEIKKAEKMKADFTANVSHELKTPITVLKGYIETLEDEINEDKKPLVKILKKHIERLSNLVSDVLLLSRLDAKVPLEKEYFNFKELILSAVDAFNRDVMAKNITLKIDIQDNLIFYGDSFLIFQAIINLVSNAIKFTPQQGTIEINATISEESLFLRVSDTGPGIPKEYYEKIFQRFFVIDKSRSRQLGGTGLGLSIVKHIIELHNGKIDVESEMGKGTAFIITLPLSYP